VRYETTPAQLRELLGALRELLRSDARVDPHPLNVRFVNFNSDSLDNEIFTYIKTANFDEFLAIREELYLRMMDVVAACGTGFAFPSQTTYLVEDEGVRRDAPRARSDRLADEPRHDA
jgi:MscS family membrane protein